MSNQEPPISKSQKAPRAGALRARRDRVERMALGALMAHPAASVLNPVALGCLAILCRLVCGSPDLLSPNLGVFIEGTAALNALAVRGVAGESALAVLAALEGAALLQRSDTRLCIPVVAECVCSALQEVGNRSAGWQKRGSEATAVEPVLHTGAQAPAAAIAPAPVVATAPEVCQRSLLDDDSGANAFAVDAAPESKGSGRSAAGSIRRFGLSTGPEPLEEDVTVVRLICIGERVAEITQSYAAELKAAFPSIDVDAQLKIAANWCSSNPSKRKTLPGVRKFLSGWMNRAASDLDMRTAVIRANASRNGFGQGASYGSSPAPEHDDDGLGEFAAVHVSTPQSRGRALQRRLSDQLSAR